MKDTVIGVDHEGNDKAIQAAGKSIEAQNGVSCPFQGDVTLLSTGGVHCTADTDFTAVQIIATGPIKSASDADVTMGLSLQSWDDIEFSAKAGIHGCPGVPNDNGEFARFVKLAA